MPIGAADGIRRKPLRRVRDKRKLDPRNLALRRVGGALWRPGLDDTYRGSRGAAAFARGELTGERLWWFYVRSLGGYLLLLARRCSQREPSRLPASGGEERRAWGNRKQGGTNLPSGGASFRARAIRLRRRARAYRGPSGNSSRCHG